MAKKETEIIEKTEATETVIDNGKINIEVQSLEPRATEKTYGEQTKRVYVFPVEKSMGKLAVKEMVEREFQVTVTDVKTLIRKGKKTRYARGKRAYPGTTYRQDKKFAYVRLAEGDSIRVFEEQSEAETKDEKEKKAPSVKEKAAMKVAEKMIEREEKQAAKEKAREEKTAAKAEKAAGKRGFGRVRAAGKAEKAEAEAGKSAGKEKK